MDKRSKPRLAVAILGIILVTAVFFQARPLGSSEQIEEKAKDGFSNSCRIFVKGHYAYVIRRAWEPQIKGYLWIFDVGVVGDSVQDTTFTATCFSDSVRGVRDVFVSGGYVYVTRRTGIYNPPPF